MLVLLIIKRRIKPALYNLKMRKSLIPQTPVIKKNQDESQAARTN